MEAKQRSAAHRTYVCSFGLELVEPEAVLQEIDKCVRLDVRRKRQRLGIAHPAARKMESGITVACFLQISGLRSAAGRTWGDADRCLMYLQTR